MQEANLDRMLHRPYQHPMVQEAINITWFRSVFDVGLRFRKHFSPLSVPAIAFILTAVRAMSNFDSCIFLRSWLDRVLHRRMA